MCSAETFASADGSHEVGSYRYLSWQLLQQRLFYLSPSPLLSGCVAGSRLRHRFKLPSLTKNLNDRIWQRQQVINYWNQRIELNKARWNAQMRATFDRNMSVIDQAVSESMNELNRNPHDEISEQMLNEAMNDKLALLKEFSDL